MSWYNPFSWFRKKLSPVVVPSMTTTGRVSATHLNFAAPPRDIETVIRQGQDRYRETRAVTPPIPKKTEEKKKEVRDDTDYLTPALVGYAVGSMMNSGSASRQEEHSTYSRSSGDYSGGGSSVSVDDNRSSYSESSYSSSDSSSSSDSGSSSSGSFD